MTHVLNLALRKVLGEGVDQKGSIVTPEKLRFDFNAKSLKPEELKRVQNICNEIIAKDYPIYTKVMPYAEAQKINTLRCMFGEKYPANVRVVSVGAEVDEIVKDPTSPEWMGYSVELCGGTHVQRT